MLLAAVLILLFNIISVNIKCSLDDEDQNTFVHNYVKEMACWIPKMTELERQIPLGLYLMCNEI